MPIPVYLRNDQKSYKGKVKTGKIERFEDLVAWQKARQLTKQIYLVTGKGQFAKDYGLRDQIRRASVSIMSNLAGSAP